jgi:hypothetical protein
MGEINNAYKAIVGKPEGNRSPVGKKSLGVSAHNTANIQEM